MKLGAEGKAAKDIIRAIDVLERSPLIGRPVRADMRELVIGRRARDYVALYRYVAELDTVFVLAIRGKKEVATRSVSHRRLLTPRAC